MASLIMKFTCCTHRNDSCFCLSIHDLLYRGPLIAEATVSNIDGRGWEKMALLMLQPMRLSESRW
jgi:hypothetical protein